MKRRLLGTTMLGTLALVGCAITPGSTTSVQTALNEIQFVLPLLDVMALGIGVAVPAAAPLVAAVTPYLNAAGPVFQTLSTTMTQAQAQPVVQQIVGYVQGTVTAISQVINAPGADPRLAAFVPKLAQAQAVLGLLLAFVNGLQPMAPEVRASLPVWLHK